MHDPRKPLGTLAPAVIAHLTEKLGPPQPVLVTIVGGKDVHADCWKIGAGRIELGDPNHPRITQVEIFLTPGGSLLTTRRNWTEGGDTVSQTGSPHATPDSAYQWLLQDGKGKLGPASKKAWIDACSNVPPMAEFAVERIA